MSNLPPPEPCAPREIVRVDHGWISGPMPDVEPVAAEHVRAGDVLILDDGTVAEVDDIRHGWYWLAEGHEPGIAIGWKAVTGQSSGVMFRRATDTLQRVTG